MNVHLKEIEIVNYVQDGPRALSGSQLDHLDNCLFCRQQLAAQKQVHGSLLQLEPRKLTRHLFPAVNYRLRATRHLFKPDWMLVIAIVLLTIIGVFLVMSNNMSEQGIPESEEVSIGYISQWLPDYLQSIDLQPVIDFFFNRNVILVSFILLVVIFYHWVDRKILHRILR